MIELEWDVGKCGMPRSGSTGKLYLAHHIKQPLFVCVCGSCGNQRSVRSEAESLAVDSKQMPAHQDSCSW